MIPGRTKKEVINREYNITFLDLFAGGGGLSEGFIRAGFTPMAHVEKDVAACYTLKTRMIFHYLKTKKSDLYMDYLHGEIDRESLYDSVSDEITNSVINAEINEKTLKSVFMRIDKSLNGMKLDVIIGGPPCQAYSLVGRSRDRKKMEKDSRNYLYILYAEFLKRYKPEYFLFENVVGLLSAKSGKGSSYFKDMRELFRQAGYSTKYEILNASQYGVLQNRKRVILVGKKGKGDFSYPQPDTLASNAYVNDIFCDLPALKAGEGTPGICQSKKPEKGYLKEARICIDDLPVTQHWARSHTERDLEIYRIAVKKWNESRERLSYNDLPERLITHKNRTAFTDRFKVVAGELPYSHTVMAHIAKDGHYYIHPDLKQNRSLTPREAARLQTFPDDYYFESATSKPHRSPAYVQIGNAVPVLLAQKIAEKLKEVW